MALFDPQRIGRDNGVWMVAQIVPGPYAGSATIPGAYIRSSSGEIVNQASAPPALICEGKWERLSAVRGAAPRTGGYDWTQPLEERLRTVVRPDDVYAPFVEGGVIVCQYTADAAGRDRFEPHWLLPRAWASAVKPAMDAFGEKPGGGTVRRSNPLVAISMARRAVDRASDDPAALFEVVSGFPLTNDFAAAVLTYLILLRSRTGGPILPVKGKGPWRVRPTVLGAAAVITFHSGDADSQRLARETLESIDRLVRRRSRSMPAAERRYVTAVLAAAGLGDAVAESTS